MQFHRPYKEKNFISQSHDADCHQINIKYAEPPYQFIMLLNT